ncbi:MAG: putative toxin-antitoxin system toxin component, PIN family [Anaerolineales bacterium]
MLRVVIEPNVLVSSMISKKGAPAFLTRAWSERLFDLVISEAIIAEIERVLSEHRLKQAFNISDDHIARLVELLRKNSILVPGSAAVAGAVPADPADEMFLAAALDGNADVIVSGDKDLLEIESFRGIAIITPRQFLDRTQGQ